MLGLRLPKSWYCHRTRHHASHYGQFGSSRNFTQFAEIEVAELFTEIGYLLGVTDEITGGHKTSLRVGHL